MGKGTDRNGGADMIPPKTDVQVYVAMSTILLGMVVGVTYEFIDILRKNTKKEE